MPYSFRRASLQRLAKIVDLAVLGFASLTALVISSGSFTWPSLTYALAIRIKVGNLFLLIGFLALCSFVFSMHGFYWSRRSLHWKQRTARILSAVTFIAGALLILRSPLALSFATDTFLVVFWSVSFCVLNLAHEMGRALQSVARLHGRDLRNVVIVGEDQRAKNLAAYIEQQPTLGYRVLQIITAKDVEV